MKASNRAVSTALTYIILLSITLILLVFTLQSFADFQLQIRQPMASSLSASKAASEDYASMMGLEEPEVESKQLYSGPEAAQVEIETYPPYSPGEQGEIRVRITNPTQNVMWLDKLEVISGLFEKTYSDIRIIYTEDFDILFTPGTSGEFQVTAKVKGGAEAKAVLEVEEKTSASPGPKMRGTIEAKVEELTFGDISGRAVAIHCNYTNASANSKGKTTATIDKGCSPNAMVAGYFTGKGSRYSGSFYFLNKIPGEEDLPSSGYQSKYLHYYSWYSSLQATGQGLAWSNESLCAKVYAWGEAYDYYGNPTPSGATAKLLLLQLDSNLQEMKRLYDAVSTHLEKDYLGILYPEVCSDLSSLGAVEKEITRETIIQIPGYPLKKLNAEASLVLFPHEKALAVPVYRDSLSLPNDFSGEVSLYLYSTNDMRVKVKLNRYWITGQQAWAELPAMSQFKIDISDYIILGNIENSLEFWVDPDIGAGDYPIQWGLQLG